ncbi:hypothetical protein FNV43_RR18411 [Rhamnella rubrinervis]|uniref:Uncharacterized protein n=1 Tax=Rhamnella rubrinervis TaxID=2594499 RepID=A0A8K0E525_9ROSA|nr:hypothetical protein FNV43_RR18411 [Rhamnella rubrinervis]
MAMDSCVSPSQSQRGDIVLRGDKLIVLGVMHLVPYPLGYHAKTCPGFFEIDNREVERAVSIEVKIIAGFPTKQVVLQEVMAINVAWLMLDRMVFLRDPHTVEVLKPFTASSDTDHVIHHEYLCSISKSVDSQARDEILFSTYGSLPSTSHCLERCDTFNSSSQNDDISV